MRSASALSFLLLVPAALGILNVKHADTDSGCLANDLKNRGAMQSKLASICEDMCKEVGAYPNCAQCKGFVPPDATPGEMTWPELLTHMGNLYSWTMETIDEWHKMSLITVRNSVGAVFKAQSAQTEQGCVAADLEYRSQVQTMLGGFCEDMCKEVGSYPKCTQCSGFVAPDSTPGVMTWPELLTHMGNIYQWTLSSIDDWHKMTR